MNARNLISALAISSVAIIGLSGCATTGAAPTADPKASSAGVQTETQTPAVTPPLENQYIKQFGDVVTYDDGVSVSVALIGAYTPGKYAQGVVAGEQPTVFQIVITNNSTEVLEPTAVPSASSGGQTATYIGDIMHPDYGDIGMFPTTSVLPGQTIQWYSAFSIVDPANITFQLSPVSFTYENAIFTNLPF